MTVRLELDRQALLAYPRGRRVHRSSVLVLVHASRKSLSWVKERHERNGWADLITKKGLYTGLGPCSAIEMSQKSEDY